jgi:hypothetical protein
MCARKMPFGKGLVTVGKNGALIPSFVRERNTLSSCFMLCLEQVRFQAFSYSWIESDVMTTVYSVSNCPSMCLH